MGAMTGVELQIFGYGAEGTAFLGFGIDNVDGVRRVQRRLLPALAGESNYWDANQGSLQLYRNDLSGAFNSAERAFGTFALDAPKQPQRPSRTIPRPPTAPSQAAPLTTPTTPHFRYLFLQPLVLRRRHFQRVAKRTPVTNLALPTLTSVPGVTIDGQLTSYGTDRYGALDTVSPVTWGSGAHDDTRDYGFTAVDGISIGSLQGYGGYDTGTSGITSLSYSPVDTFAFRRISTARHRLRHLRSQRLRHARLR